MTAGSSRSFREAFDELHEIASAETGLHDFGDASYRETLAFLLECFDRESKLGDEGREATRRVLIGCLAGRLYSTQRQALHPESLRRPIERPLVIAGLPRTGSTALHKLLAADPGCQALEYWLACQPDARPPRDEWPQHLSYRAAVAVLEKIYAGSPELLAAHAMKAGEPDECRLLFMQDFMSTTFSFNATLPSFEAWIFEQDMRPAYARYRDNLQLIGANESKKRWVLKNSAHLWALPALESTFPDACLVQTHRNPVEWISSIASVVHKSRLSYEPEVTKREVGEQQLEQWSRVIERSRVDRQQLASPVLDVHYRHFVSDPIATVRRIYDHCDWPWSAEAEKSIRAWGDANRQHQHGEHSYSAEEYGLSEAAIEERFADYLDWEQQIVESI